MREKAFLVTHVHVAKKGELAASYPKLSHAHAFLVSLSLIVILPICALSHQLITNSCIRKQQFVSPD